MSRRVMFLPVLSFLVLVPNFAAFASLGTANEPVDIAEFDKVDPHHIVPDRPLKQALTYLKANRHAFRNQKYVGIVDFSRHTDRSRLFLVNTESGQVESHLVSHGAGSDPQRTGYAQYFSNRDGTHMSSLGLYRTAETFNSQHGYSLRLDGLSPTNNKVRSRGIIMHPASYVSDRQRYAGRSWGCFALDPKVSPAVITKLKGGALIYAWTDR